MTSQPTVATLAPNSAPIRGSATAIIVEFSGASIAPRVTAISAARVVGVWSAACGAWAVATWPEGRTLLTAAPSCSPPYSPCHAPHSTFHASRLHDPHRPRVAIHLDHRAIGDSHGRHADPDHRRDAILARHHRRVAEHTARIGHDSTGGAEERRPGRRGRLGDEDVALP